MDCYSSKTNRGAKMNKNFVIGLDYGTDSVRAVIVNPYDGAELAADIFYYPRWAKGLYCEPSKNQFRQHPKDYLEGLQRTVENIIAMVGTGIADNIRGISIDTTGSTPIALDQQGQALALNEKYTDNPNGMFVLWKDHTAIKEASEINHLAKTWGGEDFTSFSGGMYSSEWFWAKILHILRKDEQIANSAFSWVEHCDWIPAILTGNTHPSKIKRSRCAAGHKAMWHEKWAGLPSSTFLTKLDPLLTGIRDRLYSDTFTADQTAGYLCVEWADKLGLKAGIPIGAGAIDAHMGAVGAEIKPNTLVKVIGTSTCDMITAQPKDIGSKCVAGICGQVAGSIVPGFIGMEAGQSAFGDIYTWFKDLLAWPLGLIEKSSLIEDHTKKLLVSELSDKILTELSKAAEKESIHESAELAVDWLNGRRTPDANQALKGALLGLSLGSDAPRIFRALVESTAFGARKIQDQFILQGVEIKEVIAIGGVAKKSPFVMQVLADVLNREIKVTRSDQTVALGAAMFAAVVAGIHPTIEEAQRFMGAGFEPSYLPKPENVEKYNILYGRYEKAGQFIENECVV